MSLENSEYHAPYYIIKVNDIEFKTYTQSGVNSSTQILDRFKIEYTIEFIKE
jgi:hypothetical protein